ncbi:MAG: J domain-containing protein [Bacteroidota bacterium]
MQYKDYYKVLGVNPRAGEEEIRKAYKGLAVKFHPDRNPGNPQAEARFKEISEAKEVLLNAANRQKYDAMRAHYQRAYAGRPNFRPGSGTVDPELDNVFSRFFEDIFGGRGSKRKGKDSRFNIKISLEEAYQGHQGVWTVEGKRIKLKIPAGVKDGQILRLKGKGNPGRNGAPAGDMLLKVGIKPHQKFQRKEDDIYLELPIDLYTAVLGKKVKFPSLKGPLQVSIPPGTQPDEKLKLKGLGMPSFDQPDTFGDLYLQIKVQIPKKLSKKARSLFEQLDDL